MADQLPRYEPGAITSDQGDISLYLQRELRRLSTAINELSLRVPHEWTSAPLRPRPGQVVWARSPWNPGGGDGLYSYNDASGQWVKAT